MSELSMIESIFHAALAKAPPDERAAFLAEACGDDADLRRKVEELLQAQENAGPFLEQPAGATLAYVPAEGPGTRIGPYKLLQQIGEGGMGIVYMAEQEQPVRRRVALKVIKPGMDSAQVIARFQAERQALAMMDHQNIARVFDAGTTDAGRPYFVMELVHGVPITKYCDDAKLTPRQRLDLFVPVCRAIQHAHQKGILHRDIKPSNVLVCLYDGQPVPKVIDFGVAKAMEQSLTERTMFTQFGQVIGTLEYMSPEQAEMSQLGVDTRSDVYSLGVLLYELLTGSTPLERKRLREAGMAEILRMIREEEPPLPSTRLSTSKESLVSIAQHRHTEPTQLTRMVRGELDWIVMKSIEKDRTRRYDSAGSLAGDLERYLKDEPVEACPPSATYRLRKYARKHHVLLTTIAAFMLLLVAGTAISTWQAVRATIAESAALDAEEAAREAEKAALEAKSAAVRDRDNVREARDDLRGEREKLRRALYASDMNLVGSSWQSKNIVRVPELLDRHKPNPGEIDLRGFEWFFWKRQCRTETHSVQLEKFQFYLSHFGDNWPFFSETAEPSRRGAISSSGQRCATLRVAPEGISATVWDAVSGKKVRHVMMEHSPQTTYPISDSDLRFSPDESLLLIEIDEAKEPRDKMLPLSWESRQNRIVELATGKILRSPGKSEIYFHDDGKRVFGIRAPDHQTTEIIWQDVRTSEQRKVVSLPFAGRYSVAQGKFGVKVAIVGYSPKHVGRLPLEIRVFDAETGNSGPAIALPPDLSEVEAELSPDGRFVVAHGLDESRNPEDRPPYQIFDSATGKLLWSHSRKGSGPTIFKFSPDGRWALCASTQNGTLFRARMRDAETGADLIGFKLESENLDYAHFSADSRFLFALSNDGMTLEVWSVISGNTVFSGHIPTSEVLAFNFNAKGDQFLVFDLRGTVRSWQIEPWLQKAMPTNREREARTQTVELSCDGRRIARCLKSESPMSKPAMFFEIIDADSGKQIQSFGPFPHVDAHWQLLSDGRRLLVAFPDGDDSKVLLLDALTGKSRNLWTNTTKFGKSAETTIFFDCTSDCKRAALTILSEWTLTSPPPAGFSPDTNLFWTVKFFDLDSEREMPAETTSIPVLSYYRLAPDGNRLAAREYIPLATTFKNCLRVLDARTGRTVFVLDETQLGLRLKSSEIQYSPNGRLLLLGGRDSEGSEVYHVRDSESGTLKFSLKNLGTGGLTFSPDGRRLYGVVNNDDDAKRSKRRLYGFWDAEDGRDLGTIPIEYTPQVATFTPDGFKLIALHENWEQRFPGDAVLVLDATPFPEDLPRPAAGKK